MIYKFHFWLAESGSCAITILLGVFMEQYTDASSAEIGALFMVMPLAGLLCRPIICSKADREGAHQAYLIGCLLVLGVSFSPFIFIPLMGPQLYQVHPRFCWYMLVSVKVIGDVAFGGMQSVGDALAINYAKRMGQDFGVYRIWGTFSWMAFGFVVGQVNELPILPKYVAGFIILTVSTLLDALLVYLWPREYFEMVPMDEVEAERKLAAAAGQKSSSLMPGSVVLAHAKGQLWRLCTLGLLRPSGSQAKVNSVSGAAQSGAAAKTVDASGEPGHEPMSLRTQLTIMAVLVRRDPRIILYNLYSIFAGISMAPLSFFFMSLNEICQQGDKCNFSQLGGYVQVSMSLLEVFVFMYITRALRSWGRVAVCLASMLAFSLQYTFYATIWYQVDPAWALLAEGITGPLYAVFVTIIAETGHMFANEVEHIMPELFDRGVVELGADTKHIKLSLAASMQALGGIMLGGGQGIGALVYGIVLAHHSYQYLWGAIAVAFGGVTGAIAAVAVYDRLCQPQLGLDLSKKRVQTSSV